MALHFEFVSAGHPNSLGFSQSFQKDRVRTVEDGQDRSACYLHEGHKPWHFHFATLTDLADAIVSIRNLLVRKVTDALAKEQEIFVVVQGGLVQEVVDSPSNIRITVIDHDTEGEDDEDLEKSPLDGQPCFLSHY